MCSPLPHQYRMSAVYPPFPPPLTPLNHPPLFNPSCFRRHSFTLLTPPPRRRIPSIRFPSTNTSDQTRPHPHLPPRGPPPHPQCHPLPLAHLTKKKNPNNIQLVVAHKRPSTICISILLTLKHACWRWPVCLSLCGGGPKTKTVKIGETHNMLYKVGACTNIRDSRDSARCKNV